MTPSIESFAALVPCDLLDRSGEVFYSGRAAFSSPSEIYLSGYNPGSDPSDQRLRTVRSSIDEVNGKPERFSLYYEAWEEGRDPKMQQGIRHMFDRTGLDPYLTPSSNCVFVRSKDANDLRDRRRLENACWPFHEAVISALGVRLILCLGRNALSAVCRRLVAARQIDQHVEENLRGWTSRAFECDRGMVVVGLTHPSVVAWRSPASDPSDLVRHLWRSVHPPATMRF